MKKILTIHFVLRIAPVFLFMILFTADLALGDPPGRGTRICHYLIASSVLYLAHPQTRDDINVSACFIAAAAVYYIFAAVISHGRSNGRFFLLLPSAVLVSAYMIAWIMMKYKEPLQVFRKDAAWCCAEEDSRSFFSIIILCIIIALTLFHYENAGRSAYLIVAILTCSLNVLLHIRAYHGYTFVMSRKKERRIQTLLLSDSHIADMVPEVDKSILAKAFKRIEQMMKDHKPYLDDKFTLEKMSDILKINKVYISRAINKFAKKNFRQYVNWYRVMYSVELMRADPWLKVIELAFMSGFHSQVTYNLCFKMFMNKTPSDILIQLRFQKPVPESSRIEVDPQRAEALPSLQGAAE